MLDQSSVIDLSPLIEPLMAFVSLMLAVLLGFVSKWVHRKTGVEVDLKNNAMVNEAIEKGVAFARARLGKAVTFETNNQTVALAAPYVIAGVPRALAYFNITPERLAEMIAARLDPPQPVTAADTGDPTSPIPG